VDELGLQIIVSKDKIKGKYIFNVSIFYDEGGMDSRMSYNAGHVIEGLEELLRKYNSSPYYARIMDDATIFLNIEEKAPVKRFNLSTTHLHTRKNNKRNNRSNRSNRNNNKRNATRKHNTHFLSHINRHFRSANKN
jgi:hypothetical protein